MFQLSIKKFKELFDVLDEHLISNIVESRISDSVEHHYSELKEQNLTEDEFQKALSKVVAVESIRQATFIAAFLHEYNPDDPIDPKDFIHLVK